VANGSSRRTKYWLFAGDISIHEGGVVEAGEVTQASWHSFFGSWRELTKPEHCL